ncbi:hypothetical protein [Kitasatospora cathayae]|uniref:Knr4/Smi1-like domain-containing protein n=1 Tax=Kitasatospora cathayae TaxID=3004092 RepID=A0ABY7QD22_9ACTN|nr:hypothetical protein [Kitasatospora sp. HUAS 3-15]WBP90659.1 hypothetical protein O1G21_35530 [Kitasatospora sp. HUAS 3-15]
MDEPTTQYQSYSWQDEDGGQYIVLYPGDEETDEEGKARLRAMGARELAALRAEQEERAAGAAPGAARAGRGRRRSITIDLDNPTPLPGPQLDPEWLRTWCERTGAALTGFTRSFEARYGFPPGENALAPATDDSRRAADALGELLPVPPDLATLYGVIDQASLPDVDNGYFIHSPGAVTGHIREHGTPAIEGERLGLVFGSDGGGRLFATGHTGRVWKSTTASFDGDFELVAGTLEEFLDGIGRLIAGL